MSETVRPEIHLEELAMEKLIDNLTIVSEFALNRFSTTTSSEIIKSPDIDAAFNYLIISFHPIYHYKPKKDFQTLDQYREELLAVNELFSVGNNVRPFIIGDSFREKFPDYSPDILPFSMAKENGCPTVADKMDEYVNLLDNLRSGNLDAESSYLFGRGLEGLTQIILRRMQNHVRSFQVG